MRKIKYSFLVLLLIPLFTIQAQAEEDTYTHVHIVDYDYPLSFEEIKSRYTSYDVVDGNLTDKLIFQSDYEQDYNRQTLSVKSYPLYVSVTNSRNKTLEWEDEISVRDFTAPLLSSKEKEISIDLSKEDIRDIVFSLFVITDNYDTVFENYSFEGLEDIQGTGTYSLRCFVTDGSENLSNEVILIVHVFETIQRQLALTPILIENELISSSELLAMFLQNNSIDTSYQGVQIQSSYLDTPLKPGIYQAEFIFNYADGTQQVYQCKIINKITDEKKKDDKIIYISLSCILFFIGLGIIIYRKRC